MLIIRVYYASTRKNLTSFYSPYVRPQNYHRRPYTHRHNVQITIQNAILFHDTESHLPERTRKSSPICWRTGSVTKRA